MQVLSLLDGSGLLLRVPKFSKYLHGVASLYPNQIEAIPYWFLPADKEGYVMTPASWEEMADPKDPYLKVILPQFCSVSTANLLGAHSGNYACTAHHHLCAEFSLHPANGLPSTMPYTATYMLSLWMCCNWARR